MIIEYKKNYDSLHSFFIDKRQSSVSREILSRLYFCEKFFGFDDISLVRYYHVLTLGSKEIGYAVIYPLRS